MNRLIPVGVAAAALAIASAPLQAADNAEAERAFAIAARSFTNCLLDAAQPETGRADLANACLLQETAFRQNGLRLRLSRGQAERQAIDATEADIIAGRRMAMSDHAQRYALAR